MTKCDFSWTLKIVLSRQSERDNMKQYWTDNCSRRLENRDVRLNHCPSKSPRSPRMNEIQITEEEQRSHPSSVAYITLN